MLPGFLSYPGSLPQNVAATLLVVPCLTFLGLARLNAFHQTPKSSHPETRKQAMKVNSTTKWTVDPSTFGLTLEQFASTEVPDISNVNVSAAISAVLMEFKQQLATLPRVRRNDLCPPADANDICWLNIIPFSELPLYVTPGDFVVFVEKDSTQYWRSGNLP